MITYKLSNGKPCKMKMCDCTCNPSDGSITIAKLAQETIDLIFEKESIEQIPAVAPEFIVTWKNKRTGAINSNLIINAEYGDTFEWSGKYVWHSTPGYSDPYKIISNVFDVLTADGVESDTKTVQIDKNTSFTIQFYSLSRSTSEAVSSVTYRYPVYFGVNNNSLTKRMSEDQCNTLKVTTNKNEYFIYKYPISLPKLEEITMDGSLNVIKAFNYSEEPFTTDTGLNTKLRVYTSANPGAFTNVKLSFK